MLQDCALNSSRVRGYLRAVPPDSDRQKLTVFIAGHEGRSGGTLSARCLTGYTGRVYPVGFPSGGRLTLLGGSAVDVRLVLTGFEEQKAL